MKQKHTELIPVRMTPADKVAIERAAEHEGMNTSEFVRAACLAYMALRLNKHALNAALEGAKNVMHELEEEGRAMFSLSSRKKVKA